MEFAYNTVCADENTKRLDELISLRAQVGAGRAGGRCEGPPILAPRRAPWQAFHRLPAASRLPTSSARPPVPASRCCDPPAPPPPPPPRPRPPPPPPRAPSTPAQIAGVLGYPTWAAYVQETLMAKNPKRVGKFLTDLEAKLVKVGSSRGRGLRRGGGEGFLTDLEAKLVKVGSSRGREAAGRARREVPGRTARRTASRDRPLPRARLPSPPSPTPAARRADGRAAEPQARRQGRRQGALRAAHPLVGERLLPARRGEARLQGGPGED
jgi:hypothetical protein